MVTLFHPMLPTAEGGILDRVTLPGVGDFTLFRRGSHTEGTRRYEVHTPHTDTVEFPVREDVPNLEYAAYHAARVLFHSKVMEALYEWEAQHGGTIEGYLFDINETLEVHRS